MQINDQGTFYVEGEYKAGDIILTVGDWELKADVDGYKKYAFGYEPDDFPELVTNGTFDTDVSGWSAGDAASDLSNTGGQLRITNGDNTSAYARSDYFPTNADSMYELKVTLLGGATLGGRILLNDTSGNFNEVSPLAVGEHSYVFSARYDFTRIYITNGSNLTTGDFLEYDNISVKLAHPQAGDTIQLGNGHHRDFRYIPYKLPAAEITELTR